MSDQQKIFFIINYKNIWLYFHGTHQNFPYVSRIIKKNTHFSLRLFPKSIFFLNWEFFFFFFLLKDYFQKVENFLQLITKIKSFLWLIFEAWKICNFLDLTANISNYFNNSVNLHAIQEQLMKYRIFSKATLKICSFLKL